SRSCRRDATRAPRPSQGAEPALRREVVSEECASARYPLQVRSTGQPPLHSVETLAGSGHHWSTQQFARRIVFPYAPFKSDIWFRSLVEPISALWRPSSSGSRNRSASSPAFALPWGAK